MRRFWIVLVILALMLSGCKEAPLVIERDIPDFLASFYDGNYAPVSPVGVVPEKFKTIVEEDTFGTADNPLRHLAAFEGKLLEATECEEGFRFAVLDFYGNPLTTSVYAVDASLMMVEQMLATSDGGFLVNLNDYGRVAGNYRSARILKYTASGQLEWEYHVETADYFDYQYCFETNEGFCTVGQRFIDFDTQDDVYVTRISKAGAFVSSDTIGGSQDEYLISADEDGDGIRLWVRSRSKDGDLPRRGTWEVLLDGNLNILEKQYTGAPEPIHANCLGLLDGQRISVYSDIFDGFDGGIPRAVMDYGDFYLIVSSNIIDEDSPPTVSAVLYVYETVYSAYDKSGNLLWRATTEPTPDYDSIINGIQEHQQAQTTPTDTQNP